MSIENNLLPEEIDTVIEYYSKLKQDIKKLEEKQEEYKEILLSVLNSTNTDIIKGKRFQIRRILQKRKYLNKKNVPDDIFNKYSITKTISVLTIKPNEKIKRSRSKKK